MANIPATPANDDEQFINDASTEDSIIPRDKPAPDVPPIIPNDAESQHTDVTGAPQASPIIPTDAEAQGLEVTDDEDVEEVIILREVMVEDEEPVTPEEAEEPSDNPS